MKKNLFTKIIILFVTLSKVEILIATAPEVTECILDYFPLNPHLQSDDLLKEIPRLHPTFSSVGEFVINRGPSGCLGYISSASGTHLGNGIVVTSKHVWDVNSGAQRRFGKSAVHFALSTDGENESIKFYDIKEVIKEVYTDYEYVSYDKDLIFLKLQSDTNSLSSFPVGTKISFTSRAEIADKQIINIGYGPGITLGGYFSRYDHVKRGVVNLINTDLDYSHMEIIGAMWASAVGYTWKNKTLETIYFKGAHEDIVNYDKIWLPRARLKGEYGIYHGMSGGGGFLYNPETTKMNLVSLNTGVLPAFHNFPRISCLSSIIQPSRALLNNIQLLWARITQLPVLGLRPTIGQIDMHLPFSNHQKLIEEVVSDWSPDENLIE